MPGITFSGIGSGIDFNAVRDAIINQRAVPINQLQSRISKYNSRVDSLKELNLLLTNLTNAAKDLTLADVGTGRAAVAADPAIASVNASSAAGLGTLNLNVTRLASSFTQASRSYAAISTPVLAGGATSAAFQLRLGGAADGPEMTIDSTNNSLAGLRDAINAADAGVSASIIDLSGDGTQQQLVLNSTATGASGRVDLVETTATGTGTSLDLRSLNPPDGDFSKLNAAFSINGLDVVRSTNDISDAVSGLNITLKKTGATTIDVTRSADVAEKLDAFVTSYNAIQDFIAAQYKKDGDGRPTGVLAGDAVIRGIQKQISSIIGIASEDNGGALTSLSEIGISLSKTGKLELDKDVLNERLAANADDVRALLHGITSSNTGIFHSAYTIANALSDNITGTVQAAINGYEASVKNLNSTIEKRTAALNAFRDILTRRFAAADAAIGQLNGQGTAIGNLMKSLTASNN
jgi:flagellar hook-associated protein 2